MDTGQHFEERGDLKLVEWELLGGVPKWQSKSYSVARLKDLR